eukprot:m.119488 g.119488  ORF g.119488 m.119488 type:complete len:80 (+) comp52058_c0_seq3:213-452(+)
MGPSLNHEALRSFSSALCSTQLSLMAQEATSPEHVRRMCLCLCLCVELIQQLFVLDNNRGDPSAGLVEQTVDPWREQTS